MTIFAIVIQPGSQFKPTGVIIFKEADKTLGISAIDENGYATLTINSNILGLGKHKIIAFYPGDKNNAISRSMEIIKNIILS